MKRGRVVGAIKRSQFCAHKTLQLQTGVDSNNALP